MFVTCVVCHSKERIYTQGKEGTNQLRGTTRTKKKNKKRGVLSLNHVKRETGNCLGLVKSLI